MIYQTLQMEYLGGSLMQQLTQTWPICYAYISVRSSIEYDCVRALPNFANEISTTVY